ncbi:MAG: hypothetical protein LBU32_06910 [Clostridiales bacterium]|jgi:hypothetical protein|nr:hypothetical protein [Clostridiales bacterium]
MKVNNNSSTISFLEIYQTDIAPRLRSLDLLLKSMDGPITAFQTARALGTTEREVKGIVDRLGIKEIDRDAFMKIMGQATSRICRLYQREMNIGSPFVYTREDVAYIYELPIDTVNQACEDLGIKKLTAYTLTDLFSRVNLQPVAM